LFLTDRRRELMSVKKIIILAVAAIFLATPAFADNIPEFETAGCDSTNIFAVDGELTYGAVIQNNVAEGLEINRYSQFPSVEGFRPPFSTQARTDFCFPDYLSHRLEPNVAGTFVWTFVLQMIPESDINVNIYDCVLKPQGTDIFSEAQQTGRVNLPDGSTRFMPSTNPRMSVTAYAADNRFRPFAMNARLMPTLRPFTMDNVLYTSKAHWEEGIVLELPLEGDMNTMGDGQYILLAGDWIEVRVDVGGAHPARLMYGPDNVLLKYIGIVGSEIVYQDFQNAVNCE
jgi:hypothetical protein